MVFIFFLVSSITLFISNQKVKSVQSEINDKKYNFILLAIIVVSFIADLLISKLGLNIPILIYAIIGAVETIFFIIINTKREAEIEKRHSLIKQVVQCLAPVRKGNELDKNLDDNLDQYLGFNLSYDQNNDLEKIECEIDDLTKWSEDAIVRIVFNLNKYIPTKQWVSNPDFPKLVCVFNGTKLAPSMAKYPGSFLRPNNFIPLGVNGIGEIGWNVGAKEKELSESLFIYEDGSRADTIFPSRAPQGIIVGPTGGGKSICLEQLVYVKEVR